VSTQAGQPHRAAAARSGHSACVDVVANLHSITGAEVSAVTLDYRVSLLLVDPNEPVRLGASLVLGVPFTYEHSDGAVRIDAEDPATLAACWRLLRRRIVTASADVDLNLTIAFDDGGRVTVERSDLYEAWELDGKGVQGVLAGPR
jgi:Family of unknown function (DUF6188)